MVDWNPIRLPKLFLGQPSKEIVIKSIHGYNTLHN